MDCYISETVQDRR